MTPQHDIRIELARDLDAKTPADILAEAIAEHRDRKYNGSKVPDPLDATLYAVLNWWETWQDHAQDPEAPIPNDW